MLRGHNPIPWLVTNELACLTAVVTAAWLLHQGHPYGCAAVFGWALWNTASIRSARERRGPAMGQAPAQEQEQKEPYSQVPKAPPPDEAFTP